MKNSNGTGSVAKLSGKRKKPWIARVTIGYTPDGRQLRKVIGTFSTKREGREALLSYNQDPNLFSKKTFKEIKDLWWTIYTKKRDCKNTIEGTLSRLKHLEKLNKKEIAQIQLFELQELFDKMNISYNFKKGCKATLNMIFNFAYKYDFIKKNKVQFIELGKKEIVVERKIFTKKEIDILWMNIDKPNVYTILILIYTGMRIGELLNLENKDIDLSENVIYVNQSKTANGIRIIPIANKIYDLVKNNITEGDKYFLKNSKKSPLGYTTYYNRFNSIMKKLKLQSHTIHDTRHTFATLLNNVNANETSIKTLIGHSSFAFTEKVYTHKDKYELIKAINLLN